MTSHGLLSEKNSRRHDKVQNQKLYLYRFSQSQRSRKRNVPEDKVNRNKSENNSQ